MINHGEVGRQTEGLRKRMMREKAEVAMGQILKCHAMRSESYVKSIIVGK